MQRDQQLDNQLDDINILLDQIKAQAEDQGEKQRVINDLTKRTDKEITRTNAALDVQNNRLKELVKRYRAPSRFCMDMVIFLLIIGLVGIIINMVR